MTTHGKPGRAFRVGRFTGQARCERAELRVRLPTPGQVSLSLEQANGLAAWFPRLRGTALEAEHLRVREQHLCMLADSVGSRGELDRLSREGLGLVERSPLGKNLCPKRTPRELCACIIGCRILLGELGPAQGILLAPQAVESLPELCGLGRQARLLAPRLKVGAALGEDAFGLGKIAGEQLDIRGQTRVVRRDVDGPSELLDRSPAPGPRDRERRRICRPWPRGPPGTLGDGHRRRDLPARPGSGSAGFQQGHSSGRSRGRRRALAGTARLANLSAGSSRLRVPPPSPTRGTGSGDRHGRKPRRTRTGQENARLPAPPERGSRRPPARESRQRRPRVPGRA